MNIRKKINKTAVVACLLLASVTYAALPAQIEADKQMIIATSALEAKDWKSAIAAFKRAEDTGVNTLPEVFLYLYGKTLAEDNRPSDAKTYLEKYLSQYGTSGKFYTQALEQLIRTERLQASFTAADLQKQEQAKRDHAAAELLRKAAEEKYLKEGVVINAGIETRRKADAGDIPSMLLLSQLYREGKGVTRSEEQSAVWMRRASEAGDAAATSDIAERYELGKGVAKHLPEAFALYTKAAAQGDPAGMGGLAAFYNNGNATPSNPEKAVEWARKGAALGSGRAMLVLSINTGNGTGGIARNDVEAARLLDRAVELGDIRAWTTKGTNLISENPPTQAVQGIELLKRAHNAGLPTAAAILGVAYERGMGVPANDQIALKYYQEAASAGVPLGVNNLGVFTVMGRGGLAANPSRGYELYREAASMGHERAIQNLKSLGLPVPPPR